MTLKPLIGAAAAGAAMLGVAFADVHWVIQTTDSGETETAEMWANDQNLRMSMTGPKGESAEMILLGAKQEAVMIDHDEKTYMVMQAAAMGETMSGMQSQMEAAMAAAMAEMDPQTRAMMESAMKGNGALAGLGKMPKIEAPTFEVSATGQSRTILGVNARGYSVAGSDGSQTEVWAAKIGDVKGGKVMRDRFSDMQRFLETALGDMMSGDGDAFMMVDKLDGMVPVASAGAGPRGESQSMELISAEIKDAPNDAWSPPAGYRKQDMPF